MMKKIALFAFQGDPMCFIHVLLNALDLKAKGHELRIILEGAATTLMPEMARDESPLFRLYRQAKEQGLFEGACRACSTKLNVVEAVELEGLPLLGDMSGHPSMSQYVEKEYEIITF
jgi:hypothetical protein